MFASKTLLSLILITLSVVDASPLTHRTSKATFSIAATINGRGTPNIAEKDRARAQARKQTNQLGKRSTTFNVADTLVSYTAQVGVGDPATNCTWIFCHCGCES